MKHLAIVACFVLASAACTQPKPAYLMEGVGNLHHPVSTENTEAQRFFDQGLRLVYAFNHEEAARSFRRAAELDLDKPLGGKSGSYRRPSRARADPKAVGTSTSAREPVRIQ